MRSLLAAVSCAGVLASAGIASAEESQPSLRVYMRTKGQPLTFSARAQRNRGAPEWCVAPCDARLAPGHYQLHLNGTAVEGGVVLSRSGTWHGELHSREAARSGGWLALNFGGIIGGVFITVAALGGPSWGYAVGGGTIAAAGLIFTISYRADRATVSFTPDEPGDVRGMPEPLHRTPPLRGAARIDGATPNWAMRSLGFRIQF